MLNFIFSWLVEDLALTFQLPEPLIIIIITIPIKTYITFKARQSPFNQALLDSTLTKSEFMHCFKAIYSRHGIWEWCRLQLSHYIHDIQENVYSWDTDIHNDPRFQLSWFLTSTFNISASIDEIDWNFLHWSQWLLGLILMQNYI